MVMITIKFEEIYISIPLNPMLPIEVRNQDSGVLLSLLMIAVVFKIALS